MSNEFWNWVASKRAHENPRGDFIRDTRELLANGKDPDKVIYRAACSEALDEYHRFRRRWERMHAN